MSAAENLNETTRNFLTPDSIRKFSVALDEPSEKVEAGLSSVVPTLINGIIHESSTTKGAEKFLQIIESGNLDGTIPHNLNDRSYLQRGETVVEDVFGEYYHDIASRITPETGLRKENVEKMMEMAAPAILGSLKGYLEEQKAPPQTFINKKKPSFAFVVSLVGILILGTLWFISSYTPRVAQMKRELATMEPIVVDRPDVVTNGLSVSQVETFLANATIGDLPKRFTFRALRFEPGTTDFGPGGDQELNTVARSLKRFPKVSASVEAYIEDTGDEEENLLLSENRAMLVREEIIGRGIEPSRIRAEGRGPKTGNQLYFVLTNMK